MPKTNKPVWETQWARLFFKNSFYLVVNGISAMKRARFMACARARWCFKQTPLRRGGIILAWPVKNCRRSSVFL